MIEDPLGYNEDLTIGDGLNEDISYQKASTEESSNQENIEANIQAVETLQEEIIKELEKEPEKEPVQLDSDRIVSKRAYH